MPSMSNAGSGCDYGRLYERDELWGSDYRANPFYREKIRLIHGMIPAETQTILDVGCGNGAIASELLGYHIIGGDRSRTALRHLRCPGVRLSIASLPFKDQSFDMVMSHQVLEHLPGEVLEVAVGELERVARRYLLVSVPYQDPLVEDLARCADCSYIYNVYGHLRSFNTVEDVRGCFPRFNLRVHAFCGPENEYRTRVAMWCLQRLGGCWALESNAVCPRCGSPGQYKSNAFLRRALSSVISRTDRLVRRKRAFWWLVCLFERVQTSPDHSVAEPPWVTAPRQRLNLAAVVTAAEPHTNDGSGARRRPIGTEARAEREHQADRFCAPCGP